MCEVFLIGVFISQIMNKYVRTLSVDAAIKTY